DRIVVDAVARSDFGHLVRHASTASDPVHQPPRALQDAVEDALRATHLPEHVHVHAALTVGPFPRYARLVDSSTGRMCDQFLVPLPTRATEVELGDEISVIVERIGVDP